MAGAAYRRGFGNMEPDLRDLSAVVSGRAHRAGICRHIS
jgi:hypothetical protein